jgi:hypothetical protein
LLLPPETLGEQADEFIDGTVIEITQRGILTDFDDPDAWIFQEDAEEFPSFGQGQSLPVREISGWQVSRLQNIDIEMKDYGSRGWNCLQCAPRNLSGARTPNFSKSNLAYA